MFEVKFNYFSLENFGQQEIYLQLIPQCWALISQTQIPDERIVL